MLRKYVFLFRSVCSNIVRLDVSEYTILPTIYCIPFNNEPNFETRYLASIHNIIRNFFFVTVAIAPHNAKCILYIDIDISINTYMINVRPFSVSIHWVAAEPNSDTYQSLFCSHCCVIYISQ